MLTPAARYACLTTLLTMACRPPGPSGMDGAHRGDMAAAAAATTSPAKFPDVTERRALYQDVVTAIRKYHVFSAQTAANLGLDWEDALKRLEPAFVEAQDLPALREALYRLACSLHDVHLGYDSGQPAERLHLGLTLEGIWRGDRGEYRVSAVDAPALQGRVQPGDVLIAINGITAEQLPRVYLDRVKGNNWPAVTRDVARFLTRRDAASSRTGRGDVEHWRLRRRGATADFELALRWEDAAALDSATPAVAAELRTDPDYLPARCHPYESDYFSLADRNYSPPAPAAAAGYRITGYGRRFCLYTSEQPPYRDYPIVRHFSFFYYSGFPRDHAEDAKLNNEATYAVAADYFALSRLLRARPQTRGLILDLRDNGGGNDPEWFLDWYAPAPYEDQYLAVRAAPEWQDPSFTARVFNIDEDWLKWYRQAAAGAAPGSWVKRPVKCLRPDCRGGNRFAPARALLKVPVALLVGRDCHSSCAHFVNVFDEYDFGPLIGEPAQATETDQLYPYPVRTRSGLALGHIKLALNVSLSGKTGRPLEGALPAIDYPVPPAFGDRAAWDAAHVAAALRAFKEYPFPKHRTPLGP